MLVALHGFMLSPPHSRRLSVSSISLLLGIASFSLLPFFLAFCPHSSSPAGLQGNERVWIRSLFVVVAAIYSTSVALGTEETAKLDICHSTIAYLLKV
jgi:hypothetical protein